MMCPKWSSADLTARHVIGNDVSEVVVCPQHIVGHVIGKQKKKGASMKSIQEQSGSRIHIATATDRDSGASMTDRDSVLITVSGLPDAVKEGVRLVNAVLAGHEGPLSCSRPSLPFVSSPPRPVSIFFTLVLPFLILSSLTLCFTNARSPLPPSFPPSRYLLPSPPLSPPCCSTCHSLSPLSSRSSPHVPYSCYQEYHHHCQKHTTTITTTTKSFPV